MRFSFYRNDNGPRPKLFNEKKKHVVQSNLWQSESSWIRDKRSGRELNNILLSIQVDRLTNYTSKKKNAHWITALITSYTTENLKIFPSRDAIRVWNDRNIKQQQLNGLDLVSVKFAQFRRVINWNKDTTWLQWTLLPRWQCSFRQSIILPTLIEFNAIIVRVLILSNIAGVRARTARLTPFKSNVWYSSGKRFHGVFRSHRSR